MFLLLITSSNPEYMFFNGKHDDGKSDAENSEKKEPLSNDEKDLFMSRDSSSDKKFTKSLLFQRIFIK